ncbi:hypothetical protein BGW38_010225 [Lunasporangiospora selenospora]|uniref:Uncharacterized protein n=1 Tax=Lunasporangiospora selenospora TaxID=979761 RepID=A0A9P6FWW1_9FUNG|nr:hypothetical protein BGW38_010225 [Lunasporangiospora selenospora]
MAILIAELPFAKTSLPSWKSWPFGMYALFAGATAVVLAFAAYHIYLGVVLTRTVPGFVGYYLLGLLIPAALTLIGYACYKQQNNDLLGLSKVYKWILHLKWKRSNAVLTRKAKKQQEQLAAAAAAAQEAQKQPAIDPAASTDQNKAVAAAQAAGTVAIPVGPCGMDTPYSSQSNFASRTGSNDHLVRALDINSDTNHSQQSQTSLPGSSGPSGTLAPTNVAPTTASGDTIHNLCQPYIPNPTRSSPVDTLGDVNELTDINGQPQRTEPAATTTSIEIAEPAVVLPPYNPYVWTVTTAGYFHPHHWQLFYILAFFTRFDHWVSRVGGGIVLGCYMQGIMGKRLLL